MILPALVCVKKQIEHNERIWVIFTKDSGPKEKYIYFFNSKSLFCIIAKLQTPTTKGQRGKKIIF